MPPPLDPLAQIAEIRTLLISMQNNQKPARVEFLETQPVKLLRPAVGRDIVPWRPINIDSQTIAKLVLPANPARVSAIIRNLSTTDSVVIGGANGDNPGLTSAGDPIGLEIKPSEALTLDMTGEVWAIMKNIAVKVSAVEIIAQVSQDSK